MDLLPDFILVSLLAWVCQVSAQTYTSCNPMLVKCPPNPGLSPSNYSVDFAQGPDNVYWVPTGNGVITHSPAGPAFTIAKKGESPTIETAWDMFFGRAEVHLRAAWGTGIVSAVVLESDDLDEIDWEWIGANAHEVQTNYFGKGNTTTWDRGGRTPVADTQGCTHNYTIDWTPSAITWYLDTVPVRTLNYGDAVRGRNFPQTPMYLKLGIWAGVNSGNPNGTITWAGGVTDYSKCPFTMYVERVSIVNANPAKTYSYGDTSGNWGSIATNSIQELEETLEKEREQGAGTGRAEVFRTVVQPGSGGQGSPVTSAKTAPP